jgi:RNA polymerase sigma-70 factor (ECF subfamily)
MLAPSARNIVSRRFETTHWSLVLAARTGQSPAAREALTELCEAYWYPIYAFIRRQGHDADAALDLTQGYFTRLLEKGDLRHVDPELGRFRAFLIASVRHFLSNARDREEARKRSPGTPLLSLDADAAEGMYRVEPLDARTPEVLFERKWAMTVLERAIRRLDDEAPEGEGRRRFARLRGYLIDEQPGSPYSAAASDLGMTEDAVKAAVHRLRRRFGELLRDEIARTVRDRADVDGELRHLLEVVGQ